MAKTTKFEKFKIVTMKRSDIKNAPYNPRKISARAKKALIENLRNPKVGMLGPVTVNGRKKINRLVGGHQRLAALDTLEGNQNYMVTVALVDLDEKTEVEQNIFMNNPKVQGEFDFSKFPKILFDPVQAGFTPIELTELGFDVGETEVMKKGFHFDDDGDLKLPTDIDTEGHEEEKQEFNINNPSKLKQIEEENADAIVQLSDAVVFTKHLGMMGIPKLLPNVGDLPRDAQMYFSHEFVPDCSHFLCLPNINPRRADLKDCTIFFYTDDSRFDGWYDSPSKYLLRCQQAGIKQIVMPNYSMYNDWPQIQRLFNLYRSRYVARYFQENGINVIPDIQLIDEDIEYVLDGIPKGVNFMCQFHTNKKEVEWNARKMKTFQYAIEKIQPKKVWVYLEKNSWGMFKGWKYEKILIFVDTFMSLKMAAVQKAKSNN